MIQMPDEITPSKPPWKIDINRTSRSELTDQVSFLSQLLSIDDISGHRSIDPEERKQIEAEIAELYRCLDRLPRKSAFRRQSFRFRGFIWFSFIMLGLEAVFLAPGFLDTYMCEGAGIVIIIMALASLVWAFWASSYEE